MRRRIPYRSLALLTAGMLIGVLGLRLWEHYRYSSGEDTAFRTFRSALHITHTNFVEEDKTDPKELVYDAINGMISGLGDTGHSRFLTPDQRRRENQSLAGRFVGIGVEMAERDGKPVVASVYPGSSAERAGLRSGDRFITINGEDVSSLPLAGLRDRLRGSEGGELQVTVLHADGQTLQATVKREEIRIPFVTWAPVEGTSLWHIRVAQFGEGTAGELDKALAAARDGGATGLILDLRDNPGGLLDEAVGVVSRFVQDGVVLQERGRDGEATPVKVKSGVDATSLPLVVLINGGSASASEVTVAALLYHQRARAVGAKTFGTGTVLQTFGLPDGSALLLGVREWLTPAGDPLRNRGVDPTDAVTLPAGATALIPPNPSSPPERPCSSPDTQVQAALATLGAACTAA